MENTIIDLGSDMVARTGGCLPGCRISDERHSPVISLDLFSLCRGYELSVYIVVADPKVPSGQKFDLQAVGFVGRFGHLARWWSG